MSASNPFQCFDLPRALGTSPTLKNHDLMRGPPYGLLFLSPDRLREFQNIIREFGNLFISALDPTFFKELRSKLHADITLQELHKITSGQELKMLLLDRWYIEIGTKLTSEAFWAGLSSRPKNPGEVEKLKIRWLSQAKWAYLSSPQLMRARDLLAKMKAYSLNAQRELAKLGDRKAIFSRTSEIALPRIPILQTPTLTIPNPFYVCPQFYDNCNHYLSSLLDRVDEQFRSLAEGMLLRLELACESKDLNQDDVLYNLVQKIQSLFERPPPELAISGPLNRLFFPTEPRKTLDASAVRVFHTHILEAGDESLKNRLNQLEWQRYPGGIPYQLGSTSSQLSIILEGVFVDLSTLVDVYDLIQFNMSMNNAELSDFVHAFCFLRDTFEKLRKVANSVNAVSFTSVCTELLAKTCLILERVRPRMLELQQRKIRDPLPQDYIEFLSVLNEFSTYIEERFKPVPRPASEILSLFNLIYNDFSVYIFVLLKEKNIDRLKIFLDVLHASAIPAKKPAIDVIRKVVLGDIKITLKALQSAIEQLVGAENTRSHLRLILEWLLDTRPLSAALVSLAREYGDVTLLSKNVDSKQKGSITLLTGINFQDPLPYEKVVEALEYLLLFPPSQNIPLVISSFIKNWIEYSLKNDPSSLLQDESLLQSLEKIFLQDPELHHWVQNRITQFIIEVFLKGLPSQIETALKEEVPLFHINKLTVSDVVRLIRFYLSSNMTLLECLDHEFYIQLFQAPLEGAALEQFLMLLNINFIEFPVSNKYVAKIESQLVDNVFVHRWSREGHRLSEQFGSPSNLHLRKLYRVKWVRRLLEDTDPLFNEYYGTVYARPSVSGLKGIEEFYGKDSVDPVLNLIGTYLQTPWYHPAIYNLLRFYFASEENSSRLFDQQRDVFNSYDSFRKLVGVCLDALYSARFHDLIAKVETEIVCIRFPQTILFTYYKFLKDIEERLRASLRSEGINRDVLDVLANKILGVGKAHLIKVELLMKWKDEKKISPELFKNLQAVLQLLVLEIGAVRGDAASQCELGNCFYFGRRVPQDHEEAVKWYLKAAEQGFAEAEYRLGNCFYFGVGRPRDYVQAAAWFRKAADKNNAEAQCSLGICYFKGQGVLQDHDEAAKWYQKAANRNIAEAQYYLASCFYHGKGVSQHRSTAVEYYKKAAEQGLASAQYYLALCYLNGEGVAKADRKEAVQWFARAAQQGDVDAKNQVKILTLLEKAEKEDCQAQFELGSCYFQGDAVPRNYKEALHWFRRAAERYHPEALYSLGVCYSEGRGVPENLPEGAKWYEKAAERGHPQAQCNLGVCYFKGNGVPQKIEDAAKWYRKAAERNIPAAQYYYGSCLYHGGGVTQDRKMAVEWYKRAAQQGFIPAQYYFALCCLHGEGLPKPDRQEALKWFKRAADQGDADAKNQLTLLSGKTH